MPPGAPLAGGEQPLSPEQRGIRRVRVRQAVLRAIVAHGGSSSRCWRRAEERPNTRRTTTSSSWALCDQTTRNLLVPHRLADVARGYPALDRDAAGHEV